MSLFSFLTGAMVGSLTGLICIVILSRKIKQMSAAFIRKTFTLRVLDSRVPTSMPIIYSNSESLYDMARYGAAGEWFNLLTIPVNEDEVYILEIKPDEQWKGWNG